MLCDGLYELGQLKCLASRVADMFPTEAHKHNLTPIGWSQVVLDTVHDHRKQKARLDKIRTYGPGDQSEQGSHSGRQILGDWVKHTTRHKAEKQYQPCKSAGKNDSQLSANA